MAAAASKARWRDCTVADPLLQIRELTKRFGGVLACDRISLDVPAGGLHAIIGPNGAGKSTLTGQLAGEINPDAGRIFFNGRDITRLPIHHRSALALARSFQITSLFLDFTVLDNVAFNPGPCGPLVPLLAAGAPRGQTARPGARCARPRRAREPGQCPVR
jgi:ABC-type uncharacterized transport system ATPase subunit